MACSCKNGASKKQVTSVKQVVKKPATVTPSTSEPQRKTLTKRVILRRHI